MKRSLLTLALCLLPYTAWAVPAFPGAEGGGAVSIGGRGGTVMLVTNLNDSGAGSLRACVTASGPRICVFTVGGTINLASVLYITNSYLTVAGQTAPGDGIFIKAPSVAENVVTFDGAHDIIWRYTKVAHGYNQALVDLFNSTGDSPGCNMCLFSGAYNTILDHNSTYWNVDEGMGAWHNYAPGGALHHVTFSYNIIAEALRVHSTGSLTGGSLSASFTALDMHHNLMMTNSHRNPMMSVSEYRHVNNLTYNNQLRMAQLQTGATFIYSDWIRNIWKNGPLNTNGLGDAGSSLHPLFASGAQSIYLLGNKGQSQADPDGDQWLLTAEGNGGNGPEVGAPAPVGWKRVTPLSALTHPITAESVATLEATLLPILGDYRRVDCTGAWVARRITMDQTRIDQYTNNTGPSSIPINETDAGGFPTMTGGTACTDTDSDGMPDAWEPARGLNPTSSADAATDRDADGYTNIEEFIYGIGVGGGGTASATIGGTSTLSGVKIQ